MFRLDDIDELKKFNNSHLADSIRGLDKQVEQVFEDLKSFEYSEKYNGIKKIVVCGMGGSGLGMRVFQSVFSEQVKISMELVNGYSLPNYVDNKTLVMLCSYSGSTEEVLSCLADAQKRNAVISYFCAGGELADMASSNGLEGYVFDPINNPSNQPRMGLGYAITAQIVMFAKLGFVEFSQEDKECVLNAIKESNLRFGELVPTENNQAKKVALEILDRQASIVGAEHLRGSAWVMRNQIHENAKNYANTYFLPELNHHLLEGLGFPEGIWEKLYFVMLESENYSKRIQQRFEITRKVLDKQSIEYAVFVPDQKSVLGEVYEILIFGSWVSYYLAYLNGIDPAPIPFVDFFKEELGKL